jgi:hypothetical protein
MSAPATINTLTDAHVRALLNPKGCTNEDFRAAHEAGLVSAIGVWIGPSDHGSGIIAKAERLARSLNEASSEALRAMTTSGETEISDSGTAYALSSKGLAIVSGRGAIPGWSWMTPTPLGRLVAGIVERTPT